MQATVLTIAGSDPTGGAGLQADLKTMTVIGVYAAAVVTCITVQNSHGVKRIEPLSTDLVAQQITAVLEDQHVTHIKIGMIGTYEIAKIVSEVLQGFSGEVIVDPVLSSTTGQKLLDPPGVLAMKSLLLNRATIVTPNLPELSAIMEMETDNPDKALLAAEKLLETYPSLRAVVVKGGHMTGKEEVTDFLLYRTQEMIKIASSNRPFIEGKNTHGTGCVLASAFAAYHCLTGNDELAFYNSTNFIQQALEKSCGLRIVKNPDGCGGLYFGSFEKS